MNKKISKLPISKKQTAKKKTIETLRLKYPRIERSCKEFQPIPPEEKKYYWAPDGKQVLRLTDTLAHEGYQEFATVDLSRRLSDNSQLKKIMHLKIKTG